MRHLLICREYPPAPYAAGGIGTYARNVTRLLAEHGETVHVIGQRWHGAPVEREETYDGRLIVHRVQLEPDASDCDREARLLFATHFPPQAFGWKAGRLAERLVEEEGIELIEAQEWEAPLYYFLLRRALGLGPRRQPPCIVHLHSPTEFIVRHNEWDPGRPDYLMAKRLEDYAVAAADAWLCPSRFLARMAERHYSLANGRIHVIPLPLGGTAPLERTHDVWCRGSAIYVGRLEPRKGVLEWVAAAVRVASRRPDAHFEFVGADLPYSHSRSVRATAERLIPPELASRFIFHGEQPRSGLPRFLARARIGVVPSRWENFPNTCVEAMGSGLPVLATRQGGMAEMIVDGETGWLTDRAESAGLAEALERALDTAPEALAAMGGSASAAIGRMCDDGAVTRAHLDFRRRIVQEGSRRSTMVPVSGRTTDTRLGDSNKDIVVILSRRERDNRYEECLRRLGEQTMLPRLIAVVGHGLPSVAGHRSSSLARVPVVAVSPEAGDNPRAAGGDVVRRMGVRPLGYLFLEDGTRPEADLVEACARTFERCPEVGVVSSWGANPDAMTIGPCPAFPYQLLMNGAGTSVAVRAAALEQIGDIEADIPLGYGLWAMVNGALAAGWGAVTYPGLLLEPNRVLAEPIPAHWRAWPRVLERSPAALAQHAPSLLLLLQSERDRLRHQLNVVAQEHSVGPKSPLPESARKPGRALRRARPLFSPEALRRRGRDMWRLLSLTEHAVYRVACKLVGFSRTTR